MIFRVNAAVRDAGAVNAVSTAARIVPGQRFVTDFAAPPGPSDWDAYLSQHGKSFWMASRLIPAEQRAQVAGVYAFCRYTDDLVDTTSCSRDVAMRMIDEWEELARGAYDGDTTHVAMLDVVIGEMAQRGVPFDYVAGLMRGMRADITGARFETVRDLEEYSYNVASVVGLWLTELFGVHDDWTLKRAAQLGIAMQLTNIARDVGEDFEHGRLYLPQSMLDEHGVTATMIGELRRTGGRIPTNYASMLEQLMEIADAHYASAAAAIPNLPMFFRPAVAVASRVYRGIHGAIRANGYDSLRIRAVTSDADKARLAAEAMASLSV